ncbi:MAG: hypothetical protein JO046_01080 [Solirubrobacterales bacterium]|nr:hypothetical protein [Solirubrobacterales bacterium]
MARLDEIVEHVDRRLEELREESTRLRAALDALGRADAQANRRPRHAGPATKPAVKIVGRGDPVKPTSGGAITLTGPNPVGSDYATQDAPVERAIRQLRQELAAGLRG